MKHSKLFAAAIVIAVSLVSAGCDHQGKIDEATAAPPPANVEQEHDDGSFRVPDPSRFPLVAVTTTQSYRELNVTGVVAPDSTRTIPVVSFATGRVIDLRAKLGDQVTKGQLLLRLQSNDVSGALADYRKAVADENLAKQQLERAKLLLDRGASPQKDYEVALDTAEKARVDVFTAGEHLKILGANTEQAAPIVNISAPATGSIIEQNVTMSAGVKTLDNSPNLFTITDLSHVWILCDVYENDLSTVQSGEYADVRLNAYPNDVFKGRISNISSVLDPNLRTAKVRLEMRNPGLMRVGMFVTARFYGARREQRFIIPTSALLHLHDRDWVYVRTGNAQFRRQEVTPGNQHPDGSQEIQSGIKLGDQVVRQALQLSAESNR